MRSPPPTGWGPRYAPAAPCPPRSPSSDGTPHVGLTPAQLDRVCEDGVAVFATGSLGGVQPDRR